MENINKPYIKCINILHFNDVYNVEEQKVEPVAGAARFSTALKYHGAGNESLVLFSGDCLNPSMISVTTQGKHIPPIFNEMSVNCALFGNHEFDFGLDNLNECMKACNFSWINSNFYDAETDKLIVTDIPYKIIYHNGLKIGIIGLVEKEWIETIPCFSTSVLNVIPFQKVGYDLAKFLKSKECEKGPCDLVIALTHMRWPNDRLLAEKVPEIDLILGGHDHEYEYEWIKKSLIIKSGSDYRTFSHLKLIFDTNLHQVIDIIIEKVDIDSKWDPDPEVAKMVNKLVMNMDSKLDRILGDVKVPLDARFASVRTKETNIGNFICDIILTAVDADIVLINSGTLRADRIIEAGPFKLRDLIQILPFLDPLIVIGITGSQFIQALENSVSEYPKHEGRFPVVGGVRFSFDPTKPKGQRIVHNQVEIRNKPIKLDKFYRLCVKKYLADGFDGYQILVGCPVLLDEEKCPILSTLIQNYFRTIQVLKGFEKSRTRHRQSIVSIAERQLLLEDGEKFEKDSIGRWSKAKWYIIEQKEKQSALNIAPKLDGRIQMIQSSTI